MYYHPLIGIFIFITALIFSFYVGKLYFKNSINKKAKKNIPMPKGEITSPDAPWLKDDK